MDSFRTVNFHRFQTELSELESTRALFTETRDSLAEFRSSQDATNATLKSDTEAVLVGSRRQMEAAKSALEIMAKDLRGLKHTVEEERAENGLK